MGNSETNEVDVRKLLVQQLESLEQSGLADLPVGTDSPDFQFAHAASEEVRATSPQPATAPPEPAQRPTPAAPSATPDAAATTPQPMRNSGQWGSPLPADDRPAALEVINNLVRNCKLCDELASKRTQTVFGVGNPSAKLVFVGEGPGAEEDRTGEPFVGAAGKLLDKILGACKLDRSQVYILNTVKCRPPMNRNPADREIRNCWNYLEKQLEVIQPQFICCLGSVAAKSMLQTTEPLGRMRGKFFPWKGAQLMVTYHPAYLLRNEGAKRHVWEDMKWLMQEMGVELSK